MRAIVNGAVLSLVLWAVVLWSAVCAGTWLDNTWSSSAFTLLMSLGCLVCACLTAVVWILHNREAQLVTAAGLAPLTRAKLASEGADEPPCQGASGSLGLSTLRQRPTEGRPIK